jgi:hypothetical protein
MRRLKLWLPLAVLAAALAVGAAAARSPQHTSPVTAVLAVNRLTMHEQTCTGDDGQYRQAQETYAGSFSGDPRLTGVAAFYMGSTTNMTTGKGTMHGVLVVTDATTHTVKVRAAVAGVLTGTGGMNMQGLMTGLVSDFGTQPGGTLVANFLGVQAGGSIYAGIGGGGGTNANPAVIQRAHCGPSGTDRPLK